MAIHIVITGHKAGKTWMYEHVGKTGRKKLVPTYHANIERPDRTLFWFAVTRDSAKVVFGYHKRRFLKNGECPPSRNSAPYRAKHQKAPRNGECLLLFEQHDGSHYLTGSKRVKRRFVLIHPAPASSLGCFGIAGGRRGFKKFWRQITNRTDNFAEGYDIRVHVEPRIQSDHQSHLAR